ncbi:MAG: magnesium transporter [Clostridia bacterium]|nr:magnesium transporter [Clostridia bacterium]MBR6890234.1 magnesium transporter [Clostridia bacterium]
MKERTEILEETFRKLAEEKKYASLRDLMRTLYPADIAAILSDMPERLMPALFRLLPKDLAAETFVEMESDVKETLIRSFSDTELKAVIDEMYMDDAVDLIEEMPANMVRRILSQADADTRKQINEILKYNDDSAGSVMTTEFVALTPAMTAADAIEQIRATGVDKETINTCYVLDEKYHLLGTVTIRTLILAKPGETCGSLMTTNVISVNTQDDQETAVQTMSKYNFTSLPVVDAENRMVGIITVDDALDIMEEEATEDIAKMAAITPSDKPYLRTGVFETWKNRIPWLLLLMVSGTFTGIVITRFEDALKLVPVLFASVPMLMDTGGNSGSQASVSVIRALSLGELEFKDIFRVIWKEFRVSFLCGLALSVANYGRLMLLEKVTPLQALTICVTMLCTVVIAKFVGCTLPLLAKKAHLDPAVMASPFITTIVDVLSLLIYFSFATMILKV